MITEPFQLRGPLPYFAEFPYYLWGQVNYDSEGDCKKPTDRHWTSLDLEHRDTNECVSIRKEKDAWVIEGEEATIAKVLVFLHERCDAECDQRVSIPVHDWDHQAAMVRSSRLVSEFEQPALTPFDTHYFWGSWKWIGWFASEFTWVGRWIMHSVVRNDPRGIPLCVDWLKVTRFPEQASALSYAIQSLSGEPARNPGAWVRWYEGSWFSKGAKRRFPQPDLAEWLIEMKREFGDEV